MSLDDMKNKFPGMPAEMRAMVEQEVAKQLNMTEITQYRKRKGMARKFFIASLVAALVLGTTVCAGVVYHMYSEPVGNYGMEIKMTGNGSGTADTENMTIPTVEMVVSYLPEGMIQVDEGKYSYEDSYAKGGISIGIYKMDSGDDQFEMLVGNIFFCEDITLNGYSGIYLQQPNLFEDEISFNQQIYVAYTDVHYVLHMLVASDVTKEEALKIAEGIKLIPVEDGQRDNIEYEMTWSEHLASLDGLEEKKEELAKLPIRDTVSVEEMKNTHAIGESFSVPRLEAKVADVFVTDDINQLDLSGMNEIDRNELQKLTDASGKLPTAKMYYIKYGDGIDYANEVVKTREVSQKFVYVTLEYTNTKDFELTDVQFKCDLVKMVQDGEQMRMYYGEESASGEWDGVRISEPACWQEMGYYDVHGGERDNNYISNIKPGETVTVHVVWIVPEEELGYMYLNLCTSGGTYEFNNKALSTGYVDIRQ